MVFKIINLQKKQKIILSFILIFLVALLLFPDLTIKVKSFIFLVVYAVIIIYKYESGIKLNYFSNAKDQSVGLVLFLLVILFQNRLLNFEIISIDVPSYLVASQGVSFNSLPFENQWESKGPVFIYLYKLLITLSFKNLIFFKILNDCLLFLITYFTYKISSYISKNKLVAFMSALFFILVTSYEWYVTELTEIYCLVFLSIHYFVITKYELNNKVIFIASLLISFSSLINQSSAIFIIGLFVAIINNKKSLKDSRMLTYLFTGFGLPQIFFLLVYFFNGLLDVYLTNYIKIPFGYVSSGKFEVYELIVWLRRYFQYSEFLYYSILAISIMFLISILNKRFKFEKTLSNNLVYLILGFSIYVIAGHNYQHHLFYSIFFLSIFISQLDTDFSTVTIFFLLLISFTQIMSYSAQPSFNNLKNPIETQNNYPLKQLADEIDSLFKNQDYHVLAVDHVLLLYYLEKDNLNYIVHPYNNFEKYIVDALIDTDLLKTNENNHLSYYIELEPDIIICAPQTIVDGSPTKLGTDIFNCEITDYKKNYFKLDTEKYLNNPNREYYYDPYISIDVFIKKFEG